ncbi:MAG TPA: hypothetical protein VJ865_05850 [Gemmatimonadaceae bacterium]|nr:hypothetical protein [Gemmatimonadaceae bacterium]
MRGAAVRIQPDSVALEQTPDLTRISVNVIIRNDRATALYFGGCWPELQEEINGQWQTVWSPVCISPMSTSVAPGDSVTFPFAAARLAQQNVYPRLDERAGAGRYRLRYGATYDGPPNYGVVYSGPTQPPVVKLYTLTSPVFVVYQPFAPSG